MDAKTGSTLTFPLSVAYSRILVQHYGKTPQYNGLDGNTFISSVSLDPEKIFALGIGWNR